MNQFSERYKASSNIQLLRVIENKSEYQVEAVEAAELEILQRKLSEIELTEAKRGLLEEQQEKEKQIANRKEVRIKIKNIGDSVFNAINPLQEEAPTTEKLIRTITIVFGIIATFTWFGQFELVKFMLTDSVSEWDLSMVEYFLPLTLLPVGILFFWRRKKIGWTLLAIYLTYSIISGFGLIVMTWDMNSVGNSAFDSLFPPTSPITQVFITLFYSGSLWTLSKNEIKEQFNISRQNAIGTIIKAGIFTVLFLAISLMRN